MKSNADCTTSATRRGFLKTTAATAGALAGAAVLGRAHAAGSDVLKVGLIGCGGRGTGAAEQALTADPNVKLTAMGDAFADRLQGSLRQLKDSSVASRVAVTPETSFTGFDAYKQVIDSGVDVVLLTTPPHFRPMHLKYAVEKGKHAFCEKPVAVDGPGVRSVLESAALSKKKGLCLASGFCWRHDLPKQETMKRIHDGAIGDVLAVHATYNSGGVWHFDREKDWTDMVWQMRNWYYFTWLSGDHIVEQHCHNHDKARWIFKDANPISAIGTGGRTQRTDPKFGHIFDHFAIVYDFPNGGKVFSYCRHWDHCPTEVSDHLIATKGACQLMKHTITGEHPWKFTGKGVNMYQVEHDVLFAAIRAGKVLNDGESMAGSSLMSIMGRMAAYTGKKITWEEALNSKVALGPGSYDWNAPLSTPPVAVPGKV
jgi:predicted dehydrogenase